MTLKSDVMKIIRTLLLVSLAAMQCGASDQNEGAWTVTTRWDYRVRQDGRYLGHADRELREVYRRTGASAEGEWIEGEARQLGGTRRDGLPVAAKLERADDVRFILDSGGAIHGANGPFPSLKGFPVLPTGQLEPGDTWEAPLQSVFWGPGGSRGNLDHLAGYRYLRDAPYLDRPARYFEVRWALRYRGGDEGLLDILSSADGSHVVTLVVDAESGRPIMARDEFREVWTWTSAGVEEREGFALVFWDGVEALPAETIIRDLERRLGEYEREEGEDTEFLETPRGLSITLRNLHFQPDLAVLIPEDLPILDELASLLTGIPGRTVLVRGHTADVGRPDQQYELSEERAKLVADELGRRGVDPRRLVYEGVGADEPAAPNDTDEGRRRNRRVELIILED